ncbi:MAG TPA: sulfotransferase [Dongiaceae bacterium]|nr:sulfotransferase [Dongiaceae bacterium]
MQNPDIGAYVQRGRQAMAERRFDDARGIYQQILALDPAQPRAWLALSALAQSQGDFRESLRAVRSAVPAWKRSGSQQFITELSMRLLVLGEYKEARDLISSANWSDPVVLRYSMGLVQYLGLAGAHREALELADHALSSIGNAPSSLIFARANALRYLGRMQEATETYERCVALDPLHAEAHWSLAHHSVSNPPGSRVPRIRKAISHTQPGSEETIYLQYALFKELDDAGDVVEAWRVLEKVTSLKRARVPYMESRYERGYQGLLEIFDAAFCERLDKNSNSTGAEMQTHTPLFIVGLPRSGTTLLERMLGNHPDVRLAGELGDFPQQFSWEIDRFIAEAPEPDLARLNRIDFPSLGRNYLARTAWRTEGAKYLVDKLPNNLVNAGLIHRALPTAKVICLRRGGMDSCFSTFKHLFSGGAYPYSYSLPEMARHYRRFGRLVEHWKTTIPDAFFCVDYEELVEKADETLAKVARFCGLIPHSDMAAIERNQSPSATASSSQVREGVHSRNIESWRKYEAHLGVLKSELEA